MKNAALSDRRRLFRSVDPKRSATMARIRSKGNRSTEKRLRAALVQAGVRGWELHAGDIAGRPDFLFRRSRIAVFVDGCFWHGCPTCYRRPATRAKYWDSKVRHNRERDKEITLHLRKGGFAVIRVWEHDVSRDLRKQVSRIKALARSLGSGACTAQPSTEM